MSVRKKFVSLLHEEMKKNEERHKENYPHPSHNLLISNMKNSLQRENVGGTLRDVLLPLLIREYGKKGGKYQNPTKLIQNLPRASKKRKVNDVNA